MTIFKNHIARFVALLLTLCPSLVQGTDDAALSAWVTIEAQAYFVEAVGGEAVSVRVLVRPGHCIELYAPSPRDLAALSRAAAYFRIGAPVESVITARLEAREKGLRFFGPVAKETVRTTHAKDHLHCSACGSGADDPHIWLDPVQMIDYIETVRLGLSEVLPERAAYFEANAMRLERELQSMHAALAERFSNHAGRSFYINHPSLGHFAARYGLEQRSIEFAGSAPAAKRTAMLIKEARDAGVGAILTQPEFGRSSAAVLASALGVPMLEVNVLGRDYIDNMQALAAAVERSFGNE